MTVCCSRSARRFRTRRARNRLRGSLEFRVFVPRLRLYRVMIRLIQSGLVLVIENPGLIILLRNFPARKLILCNGTKTQTFLFRARSDQLK
jgi:hypothetical protein